MASGWDSFHAKVVAASPGNVPLNRFMVGVLLADRDLNSDLCRSDFRWISAHGKITIAKMHQEFQAREPDLDFVIWYDGKVASPDTRVNELNLYGDSFIALRAVRVEKSSTHPAASALGSHPNIGANSLPSPSPVPSQVSSSALQNRKEPPTVTEQEATLSPVFTGLEPPASELPLGMSQSPATSTPLNDPPTSRGPSPALTNHAPQPTVAYAQPYPPASVSGGTQVQLPHAPWPSTHANNPATPARYATPETMYLHKTIKSRKSSSAGSPVPGDAALFNPADVFDRATCLKGSADEGNPLVDKYIREVINQEDVEVLEAGDRQARKTLEKLSKTFSRFAGNSSEAKTWIESIRKLEEQSTRARTVVGVVGNTGAGKSSVINALLDDRLVPTNCMRACTAVVIEISWNEIDDPESLYRAEIEFIDRTDWEKELKILLQEFLHENGTLMREASDPSTEAGIAWAKFHAVYPRIHKDELGTCTVEKLMAEATVLGVLGTTKLINRALPGPFYAQLQKFVDSKEKASGKKDKQKQIQLKTQMEFWPLIKVVRLYTKAAALSTGAVIVDLPGVHDSNAARAAVAERYMKQCTGLWIVAPITRAVDDKSAKNLLGDTFKRQLKYDGNYSAVTFICSKTDDISITEAIESLDLHDEVSELEAQMHEHNQEMEKTREQVRLLREAASVYKATCDSVEDEIEVWDDLKDRVGTEVVFAPKSKASHKRKKRMPNTESRKRHRFQDDSDIEYIGSESDEDGDTGGESDADDTEAPQRPLTMQDIEAKLLNLKMAKKNARGERKNAETQMNALKPVLQATQNKMAEVKAKIHAICIDGRNRYSRGAIQQDFAAGIKELDQEAAMQEDEHSFDPDQEHRDYEEVAKSLPVFCVSSRAYQKMCGRLEKDEDVPGFRAQEETEIPQLQAHCRKLTENGRTQACRSFLLSFCHQLTTFFLWASNKNTGLGMTDADKRKEIYYLKKKLEELESGLKQAVEVCCDSMKNELQEQIFDRMEELVDVAAESAPHTAESWGRHKRDGGLVWATYKAIVRRGGSYHSAVAGHRDFNAELVAPITKRLVMGWERAFQNRLPRLLETYTNNVGKILRTFHSLVEERAHQNGVNMASLTMLESSIKTYEQMFYDHNIQLKVIMQDNQRDASREFVPAIASFMRTVYDECANEHGAGSFNRMKSNMLNFVSQENVNMFPGATSTVKSALLKMCRQLEEEMAAKGDEIYSLIRAGYMRVLGGEQVTQDVMSKHEHSMRAEVMAQLQKIDSQFERIARRDSSDEDNDLSEQDGVDQREAQQQLIVENGDAARVIDACPDGVSSHDGTPSDDTEPLPAYLKLLHNVHRHEYKDEE